MVRRFFGGSRRPERRGTPADLLAVGLGNPGSKYDGTRHNVGADVIRLLADRHDGRLKRAGHEPAEAVEVRVDGARLALAVPTTYMNESGQAAAALVRRYGIEDAERLVVIHDELDLPPGRLKIKLGGGLAGHNGLKSIDAHLHTRDFGRVRIGVGKPPTSQAGRDHVLRRAGKSEQAVIDETIQTAADAVEVILAEGFAAAMERFNVKS